MSMLCTIFRVTPTQIAAILEDPNLVADLLDAPEVYLPVQKPKGFFARLFTSSRKSASPEVRPLRPRRLEVIPDSERYELNKTWHILHYLLTGLTEGGDLPASFIMSGGCEIGRDNGYGSPRLLSSDQTQEIATYLKSLAFNEFSSRYQRDRRIIEADVYCGAADSEGERMKELEWLWQTLAELSSFLAETGYAGGGVLVEIG